MTISLESIIRPTRDALQAAKTLDSNEIRFLVDAYYQLQDYRKASSNQIRSIDQQVDQGPAGHQTLDWLNVQLETMESQIKRALDVYSQNHIAGEWLRSVYGIGPVIAAGLMAHIDIEKAPTVGHIWRFAGLDPTMTWNKGEKRPWNAGLKVLCWKVGQSFLKLSGQAECYYGAIYRERKAYEVARNTAGNPQIADAVAKGLAKCSKDKTTVAYKAYASGILPPGQIDNRAQRYAVKLFLSHLHEVWYEKHFGTKPPLPYPIAILGHAHIKPPQH